MQIQHRYQQNFRLLLKAISYPGERVSLLKPEDYAQIYATEEGTSPSPFSYSVFESLVDGEVSIMTLPRQQQFERELTIYTNTTVTEDLSQVDYLWLSKEILSDAFQLERLDALRVGTLEDPQDSATIIIESGSLDDTGIEVAIEGPGIKEKYSLNLPLSPIFMEWLARMNSEFPLGIDLIIVDQEGECLILPRSTRIELLTKEG